MKRHKMEPTPKTIRTIEDLIVSLERDLIRGYTWGISAWRNKEPEQVDIKSTVHVLYTTCVAVMPIEAPLKPLAGYPQDMDRYINYIHEVSFGYIDTEPLKKLNDICHAQGTNRYISSDELPEWDTIRRIIALGAECYALMLGSLIAQQTPCENTKTERIMETHWSEYIELYKQLGGEKLVECYRAGVPIRDIVPEAPINV